ncbi:MAG: NblA/ycf18 family protein [Xenococcaceae cyanobacterium MO_188.B29]|nr:NblA/ycf18 family protein [Xenococcaceae cyanobacterium MO_188.B29]
MDSKNNNHTIGQLSLEQQFKLQILERDIENLTLEQAKEYLLEAFRQIMVKENICKEMIKECYL